MIKLLIGEKTKTQLTANIKENKNLYIFNGVMFIILGLVALTSPYVAAEFLSLLIGALLFLTGVFQAIVSYAAKRHWTYYLTAIISIAAGSLLILEPELGILVLAIIITIFFVIQGCLQIFYAGVYAPFKGWGWMLASGLISLALAMLIYTGWPTTAIWFLGLVVGFNLVLIGISMIMLAVYVNKL